MLRIDGRSNVDLRELKLTRGVSRYAEGSCLIELGFTHVRCTASVDELLESIRSGEVGK